MWALEHTPKAEDRRRLVDAIDRASAPPRIVRREDRGRPHHPATSPPGIPAPSWYKGDAAAFATSVRAAHELGEA